MARARQEGSSPEPVEGLARDGPRPFPLSRLVPSAVSCGLCELACLLPLPPCPAASCLPLRPHRPARCHCHPRGPPLAWESPQPPPRPAPQRSSALTLARGAAPGIASAQRPGGPGGRPHPGSPGIRGEEEQWAREIGAQLRRMADDLDALYERRRQEAQQRHRPSPWRVLCNLILGLLPLPRGRGAPEMEPN